MNVNDARDDDPDMHLLGALAAERARWRPRRGPDWPDLESRVDGARLRRYVFAASAAAAAVFAVLVGAAGLALARPDGAVLAALRALLTH